MPTIDLPQGTLQYDDLGSGPAVVFIHGLHVNGKLWRKVTPSLSRVARCIVPDLPLGSHQIPMRGNADLSVDGVAKLVSDRMEALDLYPGSRTRTPKGSELRDALPRANACC